MTDFDPYLKWLGIRDSLRPPNHYRLLGLDPFENDAEVISMAADRQMAHIRAFQIGQHGEISQRILNELAEARRCLLDPARRAAYDQTLQVTDAAIPNAISAQPVPVVKLTANPNHTPVANPIVGTAGQLEENLASEPTEVVESHHRRRQPRSTLQTITQVIAIAGGGVAALAVGAWLIQSGLLDKMVGRGESQIVEPIAKLDTENQPNVGAQSDKTDLDHKAAKQNSGNQRGRNQIGSTPEPARRQPAENQKRNSLQPDQTRNLPTNPIEAAADSKEKSPLANRDANVGFAGMDPKPDVPKTEPITANTPLSATAEVFKPRVRKAVPDSGAIIDARGSVKQLFVDGYRRSSSPEIRLAAAKKMLERAATVDGDLPANKFVLLSEAAAMAESAGDAKTGVEALDLLNDEFEVDFWDLSTTLLNNSLKKVSSQRQLEDTASVLQQLIRRALSERHYDAANELATRYTAVAKELKDPAFYDISVNLKEETKEIVRLETRAQKARKELQSDADDQKANEELGTFLCLVENDFAEGLKHWSKSGKKPLLAIAELEAKFAESVESDKELTIANAWHELAGKIKTYQDLRCLVRARYWYDLAGIANQDSSTREIEDRIAKIDLRLAELPSLSIQLDNNDYPNNFWKTTWQFGPGFSAQFFEAGTVRISADKARRTLSWQLRDDEYRVQNASDNTTFIFRPRSSGQSVAFEKVDNRSGAILLSGIGYPAN